MEEKKNIPEIRFKGFDGEWVEKRLGDIGNTFSGLSGKTKADFGHGNGRYITYMNVFSNPIASKEILESIEVDNTQNEVQFGDVIFTTSSETPEEVGMSSVWLGNRQDTYLNSFCFGYRPLIKISNYYFAYLLRSTAIRKKIVFLAQGISRYNISKNKVMNISVSLPSKKEQSQIGSFFQNLDKQITLEQQKYDKLVTLKKAMLEKMFPKEGEDVPEIRFKGFEEKWEERKLGEISNTYSGGTPSVGNSEFYNGNIPFIRSAEINCNSTELSITELGLKSSSAKMVNTGCILYALYGATSGEVGRSKLEGAINQAILAIMPYNEFDSEFIMQWLRKKKKVIVNTYLQGGQGNLSGSIVKNLNIDLPNFNEQTKIGSYFQNLDKLISLQQKKIDKLKNIKKACLEKMFV